MLKVALIKPLINSLNTTRIISKGPNVFNKWFNKV